MTRIRKIVVTIVLLFMGLGAMAQNLVETVYLKNGSVIKGEIMEQIPNQSIKIKTKDGNIFVYNMDDVERIAKEEIQNANSNRLYKGLEYGIDLGALISTTSGGGSSFLGGINIGKRFNNNFYFGGGAGINLASGFHSFPIYINPRIYLPFENSKMDLFIDLKGGVNLVTGYNSYQSGIAGLLIGLQLPISSTTDFNVGAGYLMDFYQGNTSGAIAIKTGIGFHSSTNANYVKKEPVPTRNNGMQLTIEGGYVKSSDDEARCWRGDVIVTYKLNPDISLGGGLGYNRYYQSDLAFNEEDYYVSDNGIIDLFIRGIYRFSNSKFSPFALIDTGIKRFLFDENSIEHYGIYDCQNNAHPTKLFISPALGLSLRTTNNSYIDFNIGYDIVNAISIQDYGDKIKLHLNQLYFKIGFTHTFKWYSK